LLLGAGLAVAAILWFVLDFDTVRQSKLQIPGVLQRIAACYFFASLIVMFFGVRGRVIWALVLIFGYWLIVRYVRPPADFRPAALAGRPEGLLHEWIDVHLFGNRLHWERPDPQGLLSTMTSVATTLLGVLTGNWLHTRRDDKEKAIGLFAAANVLLVAGLWMNRVFPINKKIWTSSYVLVTAGVSLHLLAMCYWLVDVRKSRWWTGPFLVFGTNAILAYFIAGIVGRVLGVFQVHLPDGQATSLYGWLYQTLFASWAEPRAACLLFALAYTLVCLVLMMPLYRRRIFVKV
jgi:predicted acyltransferase